MAAIFSYYNLNFIDAKDAVRSISETLDRDLILEQAKGDIMQCLKAEM